MITPIEELKIRARLLCKALKKGDSSAQQRATAAAGMRHWSIPDTWTLGLCLNIVSVEAGFDQWEHARTVLSGAAAPGESMGRFWYDKGCTHLLNHWFASYAGAKESLQLRGNRYLLPYERQFMVVDAPFIEILGMDVAATAWAAIGRDLVAGYASSAWLDLVAARLQGGRPSAVAAAPGSATPHRRSARP